MNPSRRTYPLAGFILVLLALYLLASALGVIPAGVQDLINRAWPALLVLAGLSILLRGRVPFSSLIAVGGALVVAGVIGVAAYQNQATQPGTGTQQAIDQTIPADLTLLRVRLALNSTDVNVVSGLAANSVKGQYTGSAANWVAIAYEEAPDRSATLTLTETQPGGIPTLDQLGRGILELELPPDIPLDVEYLGKDGDATFNLNDVALERLNVDLLSGDLVVTLPNYQPVLVPSGESNGALTTSAGNLALFIPQSVAARLELNRGGSGIEPQFDPAQFNYLVGDVLESRTIDSAPFALDYTLNVPRGQIRVESLQN
ncbi:MAG: DUF5668 domain-containing protein [Anaerolineae bacterium]